MKKCETRNYFFYEAVKILEKNQTTKAVSQVEYESWNQVSYIVFKKVYAYAWGVECVLPSNNKKNKGWIIYIP